MSVVRAGGVAGLAIAIGAVIAFRSDVWAAGPPSLAVGFFLTFALIYLMVLALATKGRTFRHLPVAHGRIVAVVPAFNEDPRVLHACLRALLRGTVRPDVIHIVDDGSEPAAPRLHHPQIRWHRQENAGKRHAQATALRQEGSSDFILTVDSDSIVHPRALEEALRAMSDSRVQAVTATIVVRNRRQNLLTRVVDLEVVSGNFVMRRARSVLGAVAPTSGAFALYRSSLVYEHLDDYLASGTYSDDRRLTHYALMNGQVVACDEAFVATELPASPSGMFRQRTRWFQGYFRYLMWELANLSGAAYWMRVWTLIANSAFPIIVLYAFILAPILHGVFYWEALVFWLVLMYAQTTHYLAGRRFVPAAERFATWLFLTPLLLVTQYLIVRPAMYFALLKLRSAEWGTRTAVTQKTG